MSKSLQKPTILNVETVARSRLFNVESVDLEFSNGVRRVYERMRPSTREAVMIVPIVDDHIILIREYAVGTESYELGFSKGLIDPGETVDEAANRELKEEVGFGANKLTFLKKLSMAPSYFSSKMNILVAEDLYPESLPGDEPEPLPQVRWPLAQLMSLLDEEDFNEARNVSALFLVREWLLAQGRTLRESAPLAAIKKRPQALFLSEQFVGFTTAVSQGGAHLMDRLLRGLGSFNEVFRAAVAPVSQLTSAAVDIHRDDPRRRG